ncbi:hypothetical protein [Nocardia macrotermitis]|uniref:Uncharacterized protein n=1 Tax=Nocardia macrotermitis TaxID=2585198 RepID=A0A7K0D0V2_9NOCA|nr:hypothetical protein [Nocardia macrotermitis]MQY19337.1 hypothetical protein [Nocardia macrotermitis]
MNTGFLVQAHVVIVCDGCGDRYSETDSAGLCFTSVNQAIAYITRRGAGNGWMYDGDKVWCDGCVASARCIDHGHVFPEFRRRLRGSRPDPEICSVCGISITEIEEI